MQIKHDSQFESIATGEAFSLALDQSGTLYSWGEVTAAAW
jgi:alpha-tubulin suppressor-like RCC1 family protein